MDKIFIDTAIKIREDYIKCNDNILKQENMINTFKKDLDIIRSTIKDDMTKDDIQSKLYQIEKNMAILESSLKPHLQEMEKLQSQADVLFENIKNKHPELSIDDIQNELIPHLSKIKFNYG